MPENELLYIPEERRKRNPLITKAGYRRLLEITRHRDAPAWNYLVGDRIENSDMEDVDAFRRRLFAAREPQSSAPPDGILEWVQKMRVRTPLFRERLPEGFHLQRDWAFAPTMTREDIAVHPEKLIPIDEDLSRLIVYDTSGVTGHATVVPFHPASNAMVLPLMEFVLKRYGLNPEFGSDDVSCICTSARRRTVVFPNTFSVWNQSGFAKVNFEKDEWKSIESARRFFREMNPYFLTGDPVGFAEMLSWEIDYQPAALVSTAVHFPPGLKASLEKAYHCPAIDWYSLTETGPIACSCPHGNGLHILPHDIYVEIVDEDGFPLQESKRGEIAVTGGRNPFLPLLRYRTGDWGRLDFSPCSCGDPQPRIVDLEGRLPVFFRAADGSRINQVDIGRIMRQCDFVQHEFRQLRDGSCRVTIRPAPWSTVDEERIAELLKSLFGDVAVTVIVDESLGRDQPGGKVIPYRSELDYAD